MRREMTLEVLQITTLLHLVVSTVTSLLHQYASVLNNGLLAAVMTVQLHGHGTHGMQRRLRGIGRHSKRSYNRPISWLGKRWINNVAMPQSKAPRNTSYSRMRISIALMQCNTSSVKVDGEAKGQSQLTSSSLIRTLFLMRMVKR